MSEAEEKGPWDLSVFQAHWFGMAISAGFSVTTPAFKLRYTDSSPYRCLSLGVHLFGVQIMLTLPLWIEDIRPWRSKG